MCSSDLKTFLVWKNSTPFGSSDAQFGKDLSFFTFELPWYQSILSWGFSTLILTTIVAAGVHFLYGGLRIQPGSDRSSVLARVQISVLLGLIVLLKAVAYYFDRFALSTKEGKLITGLSYTDVNASLPAKNILMAIAILCSLLFFANIVRKSWLLPATGVALMLVSALIVDGV